MAEYFKGVVWLKDERDGRKTYIVAGALVTDRTDVKMDPGPREYLSGFVPGIFDVLEGAPSYEADGPLGDASDVITGLNDLNPTPATRVRKKK